MSRRRRRAALPVSSSASTTIRPPTMCRPPANRSVADTSALRQHGFVTWSRLSSSFTRAVSAMPDILPPATRGRWPYPTARSVCSRSVVEIVTVFLVALVHPRACRPAPRSGAGPPPRTCSDVPDNPCEYVTIGRRQPQRVRTRGYVPETDLTHDQLGPQTLRHLAENDRVLHGGRVGEDGVDPQLGRVRGEHVEMRLRAEAVGLALL